jgi:isopenicillin-N epimerase
LAALPGVKLLTSDDPEQSCAIGFVSVAGFDPGKLSEHLWGQHRILTTPIVTPGEYEGLRITPNVYTTLEEIDTFIEVMENIIRKGKLG